MKAISIDAIKIWRIFILVKLFFIFLLKRIEESRWSFEGETWDVL